MLSSKGSLRVLFVAMVLMASAILIPLGTSQFKVDSLLLIECYFEHYSAISNSFGLTRAVTILALKFI